MDRNRLGSGRRRELQNPRVCQVFDMRAFGERAKLETDERWAPARLCLLSCCR